MSKASTPKKETKKESKAEIKKEKSVVDPVSKSPDGKPDKATDAAADKPTVANKSASQTSISHFSSVSTDEYRSGWESIFGKVKSGKKESSNDKNLVSFPVCLEIRDRDIKGELRAVLYKAFQRQARKEGISLAKCKKSGIVKYNLECNIESK